MPRRSQVTEIAMGDPSCGEATASILAPFEAGIVPQAFPETVEPTDMAADRELVLGIDFGTSNSSAAVFHDGRIRAIVDNGEPQIPTVVHFPARGEPVVGFEAVRLGMGEPADTVSSIKRVLGRNFDDPMVRALDASVGYKLIQGPGNQVMVRLRGRDFAPAQIASLVLIRLKNLAERLYGEGRVRSAVIAVPADSSQEYMAALTRAAGFARLEVRGFVPEPVAGALAYGIGAVAEKRRIAVCDYGGGTFDFSLVEQDGLRFRSLATSGDLFLGGDDFDLELADAVSGAVFRATRADMRRDAVRWQELVRRCESVKRQLSSGPEALLQMRNAFVVDRAHQDINMRIGRDFMEARWSPLVERSVAAIHEGLATAGADLSTVDQVVLVGGTSLMPIVRQRLAQLFGKTPMTSDTAHMAVVTGATVVAARHQATSAASLPQLEDAPMGPVTVAGSLSPTGAVTSTGTIPTVRTVGR